MVPQINYLNGMIPVCIPQQFLQRYDKDMIKHFLWNGGKPRIHIGKLYQPKMKGGLLANIKYYSISSEMSKLTKHWGGTNTDLEWVLIEWELNLSFQTY